MFTGEIIDYAHQQKLLVNADLEITRRCNLNCKHCYLPEHSTELPFELIERFLNELADEGTINLMLTGGEPLAHTNFIEIYTFAKKLGMLIDLKTNGLLIDERIISVFNDLPPDCIDISIYGLSNAEYGSFTGDINGFDKIVRSLDLLYKTDINFKIYVIASTYNFDNITSGAYAEYFRRYDQDFEFDYDILTRINGDPAPLQYRLNAEQIKKIEDREEHYREVLLYEYAKQFVPKEPFQCHAGASKIFITAEGNAQACLFDTQYRFNLKKNALKMIRQPLFERNDVIHSAYSKSKCVSCTKELDCCICPLKSKRLIPNFSQEDRCRLAELRKNRIEDEAVTIQYPLLSILSTHKPVDIDIEVENFGLTLNDDDASVSYFNKESNVNVAFTINGKKIIGGKGKDMWFIPLPKDELSFGVHKDIALKVFTNPEFYTNQKSKKLIDDSIQIGHILSNLSIGPNCYGFTSICLKNEIRAFRRSKLQIYPQGTVLVALIVETIQRLPFNEEAVFFDGKEYTPETIVDAIKERLGQIGIIPKGLGVVNLVNSEKGIQLVDWGDWEIIK